MTDVVGFDHLVRTFGEAVGIAKGEQVVDEAISAIGYERTEEYTNDELVEICAEIHNQNDGYIGVIANDLRVEKLAENRFQTLLENVPDPAVVVEYKGQKPIVDSVNTAFAKTFGFEPGDITEENLIEWIVPDHELEEARNLHLRTMNGEEVVTETQRITRQMGLRDFLYRGATTQTRTGIEGYLVYTDITKQKQRVRELSETNERLDRFASIVSHDLRNPLNTAAGFLDMIDSTVDMDETALDYLDRVERSHDRMEEIIEDVLMMARQGNTVEETEPVELDRMARQTWDGVDTASCELEVRTNRSIEADPSRLRQLLENLYRNTLDHAGDDLTIIVGDAEGGFCVGDTGPGFPEDKLDEVLEIGYTTHQEGTGFGLGIVAQICEAHGWEVTADNRPEGGARVTISNVTILESPTME